MESFRIELLGWAQAAPLARPVRERVFVQEQGVPLELEWDEHDAECRHAVALAADGRAVGTGRLLPEGRIGRMAVLADWRGRGVGAAILRALLAAACEAGLREITLHAQIRAAGFYQKLGFSATGQPFDEAGIAHVAMTRALSGAAFPRGAPTGRGS